MQAAKHLESLRDDVLYIRGLAHVCPNKKSVATCRLHLRQGFTTTLFIHIGDDDTCALFGKSQSSGPPSTCPATHHQRDFGFHVTARAA